MANSKEEIPRDCERVFGRKLPPILRAVKAAVSLFDISHTARRLA
jgi:hypothetical protein